MGITKPEEYFPRGGTTKEDAPVFKKKTFVFEKNVGARKVKLGKRERLRKNAKTQNKSSSNTDSKKQTAGFQPLVYKHLCEGMKIICSVKEVTDNYINVSLPGRMYGCIDATKVSQPYSTLLAEAEGTNRKNKDHPTLQWMFQKGQYLCCKIISCHNQKKKESLTKDKLLMSLDPADVNSDLTHDLISEGDLLSAAVSSLEDHGCTLFTGVPGVIAFLSNQDSRSYIKEFNRGMPLVVGQVLWCKVKKCTALGPAKSIKVTISMNEISEAIVKDNICLDRLQPGNSVDVIVVKVTAHGLSVRIPHTEIIGYIETNQLSSPWSVPDDYPFGATLKACVLLKTPHTGNLYFSLKSNPATFAKQELNIGDIFTDAEVQGVTNGNIIIKLKRGKTECKGIIPWNKISESINRASMDEEFIPGSTLTCRIINYELTDQVYTCTMMKNEVNQKYLTHYDVKAGDLVDVVISEYKKDGCLVKFGSLSGYVCREHMSDVPLDRPELKFRLDSSHRGRVLRVLPDVRKIYITMKPTLVSNPALVSFENLIVGDSYYGVISGTTINEIYVSFYGDLKTKIQLTFLPENPLKYRKYDVVKCYVTKTDGDRILFSLLRPSHYGELVIGKSYAIRVKKVNTSGLVAKLKYKEEELDVEVPVEHLSDHISLCSGLLKSYSTGTTIPEAILYSKKKAKHVFTLRESVRQFFKKHNKLNGLESLKSGMMIPCTVDSIKEDGACLTLPIPGFEEEIFVPEKDLYMEEGQEPFKIKEGVLGKFVTDREDKSKYKLICNETCNVGVDWIIGNLRTYLKDAALLQSLPTCTSVTATITKILPHMVTLKIGSRENATMLKKSESEEYTVGDNVQATVLFQNPVFGTVRIIPQKEIRINNDTRMLRYLTKLSVVSGTVVFGNTHFQIAVLNEGKLDGLLVYIPVCLHPNSKSHMTLLDVGYMSTQDIVIHYIDKNIAVGFLKRQNIVPFPSTCNKTNSDTVPKITKEKKTGGNDKSDKEVVIDEDNQTEISSLKKKNKRKSSDIDNESMKKKKLNSIQGPTEKNEFVSAMNIQMRKQPDMSKLSLRDAASFIWNATPDDLTRVISGTSKTDEYKEESDDEVTVKRKLTPAEKRIAAQENEKKIREKEEELLNIENDPKSIDHFERLVLASPNSSIYWIKYMAFHLQATEIEKARGIAKRALKQMNIREEKERMNIWVALLNLENLYGTPESFKEALDEALKLSDDYQMYLKVLEIYAGSDKTHELEHLANMMVRKYRSNSECYLHCMSALMKVGLCEKSRNFLQRALSSIPQKEHVTLISRFALMENQYGYPEQAQALFENVLTSYPSRVDVWSVYVDMLVKSGSIALARQVLERAAGQQLPAKKMKSIYSKWLSYEENHGNEESVRKVKEAALQYVNNVTSTLE